MLKRTKIIATLGPSTDDAAVVEQMIAAGLDMVRVNFSHGAFEDHQRRIELVHECARNAGREIGVLADLQGPKIRIACFQDASIVLKEGAEFVLDAGLDEHAGTENEVGIDYKTLPKDVAQDDILLLDDGRIHLKVKVVKRKRIVCEVMVGGVLSNHKGINRLGGGLSAGALTDKDRKDIDFIATLPVDYVAISFPRSADDIHEARSLLYAVNCQAGVIAKIERVEAVDAIDELIDASDGVMVARGDLAVEIGDADVPGVQKNIIHRARALDKPVITATQMMESMIESTIPTRAEVSDVANAVLDGTDAVMLSAETAVGKHPEVVIEAMARVCLSAEKHPRTQISRHRVECHFERADEAIAMAAMYTANHVNVKAIIALTETGSTALWMSRIRTAIPIYGLSRQRLSRGKMTLYRSVYPIAFDVTKLDRSEVNRKAVTELRERGIVADDDLVLITRGDFAGTP